MSAEHAVPQTIALLLSWTVPDPLPVFWTVTCRAGMTNVEKKKSASAPTSAELVLPRVQARPPGYVPAGHPLTAVWVDPASSAQAT